MEREISDSSGVSSPSLHKHSNSSSFGPPDCSSSSPSAAAAAATMLSQTGASGAGSGVLGLAPEYCLESWLLNQVEERMVTMPNIVPRFKLAEAERDSASHLIDKLLEDKGAAGYSLDDFINVMKETVFCMMTGGLK